MCRKVTCDDCGKPTFAGCGKHVEQVLADVPRAERCTCREERAKKRADAGPAPSLLDRIFGRS